MLYATPHCEVTVNGRSIDRRISQANVECGRCNPASYATVVLDNRHLDFNGFAHKGDSIQVSMGYRNLGAEQVFTGTVLDVDGEADYTIYAKDDVKKGHDVRIIKAFQDVKPNDVITYCVNQAGLAPFSLGGDDYPKKKLFVLRNTNLTDSIRLVERTWGIVGWEHYIDHEGVFRWEPWKPKDEVYTFATGENILGMEPFKDLWRLHTFLFPQVHHSDVVRVLDERVGYGRSGELFRVERVTYRYGDGNSMYLWLRELGNVAATEGVLVHGVFQEGG